LTRHRFHTTISGSEEGVVRRAVAVLLALGFLTAGAAFADAAKQDQTQESGLVEQTGRRLVQLDVSVSGPPEVIDNLEAKDFQLTVGGRPIEEFYADRVCGGQPPPAAIAASPVFKPTDGAPTPVAGGRP
jgi:hypothetical protein